MVPDRPCHFPEPQPFPQDLPLKVTFGIRPLPQGQVPLVQPSAPGVNLWMPRRHSWGVSGAREQLGRLT